MAGFHTKTSMPQPQLFDQPVQATIGPLESSEILIDIGLGRAREAAPHTRLYKPEEQLVSFFRVERAAVLIEIADQHWDRKAAEEHAIVV